MLRKVEKSAKSLDEALELAAKDLGVPKDEISYEVTREVGKGLLGFLIGKEVEITAWITGEGEDKQSKSTDKPELDSSSKKAGAKSITKVSASEDKDKSTVSEESFKQEKEKRAQNSVTEVPKSAIDDAKYFLSELLNKMGIAAELYIKLDNNVINIDVSGEKMGLLIGKRGDTLDSVQYLTSLYVNRNKNSYIKIDIDTENYRAKREETLVHLAHGLERRVIKDRKPITLEPMSPNERRIIHSTLQNNHKIRTYSIGEEPNRKVVVALNRPLNAQKTSH